MTSRFVLPTLLPVVVFACASVIVAAEPFSLRLRSRVEVEPGKGQYTVIEKSAAWLPQETAVIVCDMWDYHHCLNAVRRGTELTPTMDRVLKQARAMGATIIHAPSSCMEAYKDHPARKRAQAVPRASKLPAEIGSWCYKIPSEEKGQYPIDQTDGGEDDDLKEHAEWAAKLTSMGRNPKAPWKAQTDKLTIDSDRDYISDSGEEIWSLLEQKRISNVILLGVHTNMCVLGRPFGLRQMSKNGKNVVLMRDMTDTMYNPERSPRVSHFAGTELIVEHVEKYVCPTITSDQLVGGVPFRFEKDKRPQVLFVIGDDEYKTEVTLPQFASNHLVKNEFHVEYAFASEADKNDFPGLTMLRNSDVAVISARRRLPTQAQVAELKRFAAEGRGIVGIRTANHAFAARAGSPIPVGHADWANLDAEVLGGNYSGHHKEGPQTSVARAPDAAANPILRGVEVESLVGHGSLYKVSPLKATTRPLLLGTIPGQPTEPIAWINQGPKRGRVFYTSLGHPADFANPAFTTLLKNAIAWSVEREMTEAPHQSK